MENRETELAEVDRKLYDLNYELGHFTMTALRINDKLREIRALEARREEILARGRTD